MASFDEEFVADPDDVQRNKIMGIIAYLGCLCFVPLIAAKDSQFARYHASQGVTLFVLSIALSVIKIALAFMDIPMIGMIIWIIQVGLLVLMVLGIVNAVGGKMKPLPIIGGFTILK